MLKTKLVMFLKNIRKVYLKARKPILKDKKNKNNIRRGENRQIYSISEDLFAELVYDSLNNNKVYIFINQPISFGKRQPRKPDVTVCTKKNNVYIIKYMLDLKMDTGHIRKKFKKHADYLKKICNNFKKSDELHGKDGITKEKMLFKISKKASYDEVVVCWGNNSKDRKQELLEYSNDKNVNIWVLSIGDKHLNTDESKKKDFLEDFKPNNKDWNVLVNKIKKNLRLK